MADLTLKNVFLSACVILTGCSDNEVRTNLRQMVQSEVLLPAEMNVIFHGNEQMADKSIYRGSKFIIFIDSTGCTSCQITNLERYQPLFQLGDSTGSFTPLILVSPAKVGRDSIVQSIIDSDRSFPIYVDVNNQFLDNNSSIPRDKRYYCDESLRPVIIGDPIHNPKIMELLEKYVTSKVANDGDGRSFCCKSFEQ